MCTLNGNKIKSPGSVVHSNSLDTFKHSLQLYHCLIMVVCISFPCIFVFMHKEKKGYDYP